MDRKIGVSTKVYGSIHISHNDDTDIRTCEILSDLPYRKMSLQLACLNR